MEKNLQWDVAFVEAHYLQLKISEDDWRMKDIDQSLKYTMWHILSNNKKEWIISKSDYKLIFF